MNQLNFTEIHQEKIKAQQHLLKKFEHLTGKILKKKTSGFHLSQAPPREDPTSILRCLKLIDKLYKCIREM